METPPSPPQWTLDAEPVPRPRAPKPWSAHLKGTFLSGLVVIAPLGLTVYVLHGIVVWADQLFYLLPESFHPNAALFPGASLILAIGIILVAGFVARNIIGAALLEAVSRAIERVPVVASLYRLLRQVAEALLASGSSKAFKRVVLVQWPRQDVWTMAFVTSELQGELRSTLTPQAKLKLDDILLNLFVPTTPNPTGGFHFIARQSDCIEVGIAVEEALKMIISCGTVHPTVGGGTKAAPAGRSPAGP